MKHSFLIYSFYALLASLEVQRTAFADIVAYVSDCKVKVVLDFGSSMEDNATNTNTSEASFIQGEVMCIHVSPDEARISDGFVMDRIENFTFAAPDGTVQVAINDNAVANFLTDYFPSECENSIECVFSTTLMAPFFIGGAKINS